VQSLTASSVTVSNITIRWDRVDCQERNGHTDSYRIIYYPVSDLSFGTNALTIFGTGDGNRIFSVDGLPPLTNYTFEIQASNPNVDLRGPPAVYTAETTAPQGNKYAHYNVLNLFTSLIRPWISPGWSALS
jgi:hypothetical protein